MQVQYTFCFVHLFAVTARPRRENVKEGVYKLRRNFLSEVDMIIRNSTQGEFANI